MAKSRDTKNQPAKAANRSKRIWTFIAVWFILLSLCLMISATYLPELLNGQSSMTFILTLSFLLLLMCYLLFFVFFKPKTRVINKSKEKVDNDRRKFLTLSSSLVQTTAVDGVQEKILDGIATVTKKRNPKSKNPLIPAGAVEYSRYSQLCDNCQACVSACPQKILKPSIDIDRLMLPVLNFNNGYCPIDCVKCNEACPTGALEKISAGEKTNIQIGYAEWLRENCLVIKDQPCKRCEEVCPNGSIQMIQSGRFQIPIINTGRCIGCGACQAACPASPLKAIYVKGHKEHRNN